MNNQSIIDIKNNRFSKLSPLYNDCEDMPLELWIIKMTHNYYTKEKKLEGIMKPPDTY